MPTINLNLSKSIFVPKFLPYLTDYSHRWEFWYGGAGSAKSYTITQKLIIRALNEPIRIMVCRKYATTLRNTCFSLFKEILAKWKLLPYVKINESDFRILFTHNKSEILFMGLDTEEKLLSLNNISTIFIEEAFEVPREMVEQLNLRMRGKAPNQQIILSWNPISKNHWLYNFAIEEPPANSIVIHSTFADNPFLPQSYVDSIKELEKRNPAKYQIYGLGQWGVITDALVFHNWHEGKIDTQGNDWKLLCGLDFGYIKDATAFIVAFVNEATKELYIADEHYQNGMLNDAIAQMIIYKGFGKEQIIADSAEQKSIEEIKRLGVPRIKAATKGKGSILQGIQKLQQYDITVNPACANTLIELQNYTWVKDKNTGAYTNEPIDSYNHCLDALRYSLQCLDNQQRLKTIDKALFGL